MSDGSDNDHDVNDKDRMVRRVLHLRFTLPGADSSQLAGLMRAAAPFYQMFGNASFKLLRNADDRGKFIQVIEYETPESFEINRQSIASDMRLQAYFAVWRAMVPGGLEIDVYEEV